MQIEPQKKGAISSTPFLQELIGILAGFYISMHTNNCVMAYTDCKAALAKVKDALTPGSNSTLHLPYGPLIGVIGNDNKRKYQIDWIASHPEKKKKKAEPWNMHDHGIYSANLVATDNISEIIEQLPTTTVMKANATEIINTLIPANTYSKNIQIGH